MSRLEQWTRALFAGLKGRERGSATIMALVVLGLGSLIVVPTVNYMATGVVAAATHRRLTSAMYAADAGVEYAMWRIKGGESSGFSQAISVGGTTVNVTVSVLEELPYGPVLTEGAEHADWLSVTTTLTNLGGGVYSYSIHIQNVGGSGNIKLETIGAGLPDGYTYVSGSSSGVTSSNPAINGRKVTWQFSGTGRPSLNDGQSVTQTFQISGSGAPQGYYSWIVASRDDVGTVSSCFGFTVVSQASGTTITSDVVKNEGIVYPVSWNLSRTG